MALAGRDGHFPNGEPCTARGICLSICLRAMDAALPAKAAPDWFLGSAREIRATWGGECGRPFPRPSHANVFWAQAGAYRGRENPCPYCGLLLLLRIYDDVHTYNYMMGRGLGRVEGGREGEKK